MRQIKASYRCVACCQNAPIQRCKEKEDGHWFLGSACSETSGVTHSSQVTVYMCLCVNRISDVSVWVWNQYLFPLWCVMTINSKFKYPPICPIMKQHQYTHTLKWRCRKSAYQAFHAAFFHIKSTAIHNVNQKVVLCYSSVLSHCFEGCVEHNRGKQGLDQLK